MKINVRNGIFETNSSSTHAVALIDTKTEFKNIHGDYERKILSKKHKLIFLCSVLHYQQSVECEDFKYNCEEKGKPNSYINENVKRIKNTYEYYENLAIKIYSELTNENLEEVTKLITEIHNECEPAFLDYFNNDTLDGYYGSHLKIAKNIFGKPNDDGSLIEKLTNFFDDTVYIQLVENWYGGGDRDLPNEF